MRLHIGSLATAIVFAFSGAAIAQDWTATTIIGTSERYAHSGDQLGLSTRDPENEWLATEAYVVVPASGLDCASAQEIEIDHYYGVDNSYAVHLMVTAVRENKDNWVLYDPEVYMDRFDRLENPTATYTAYPAQAKLLSWECQGESVALSLSFKAQMERIDGTGPDEERISGTTSVQVRLLPYDNY